MGNLLSVPESMKGLPNRLKQNEYVEIITIDKKKFYVFPRSLGGQFKGNIKKSFSAESIGLNLLGSKLGFRGLGDLHQNLNQQDNSNFYITHSSDSSEKPDPKAKPIQSSVNDINLKGYITLFMKDPIVDKKYKFDLKSSTFEVKNLPSGKSSFGKSNYSKLKRLQRDLKQVKKC